MSYKSPNDELGLLKVKNKNEEIRMSKEILSSFGRISSICLEIIGDDCKDDLILVASAAGITEQELHEKHPELYERGADNIAVEDFKEEEGDKEEKEEEDYDPTEDDNKLNDLDK